MHCVRTELRNLIVGALLARLSVGRCHVMVGGASGAGEGGLVTKMVDSSIRDCCVLELVMRTFFLSPKWLQLFCPPSEPFSA